MGKRWLFFILFLALSAPAQGYVEFKGWYYNATGTTTGPITYNYASLEQFGYIRNVSALDVYYYNTSLGIMLPSNSSLNTAAKTLTFYATAFPLQFRLGEWISYQATFAISSAQIYANNNYSVQLRMTEHPAGTYSSANYQVTLQ